MAHTDNMYYAVKIEGLDATSLQKNLTNNEFGLSKMGLGGVTHISSDKKFSDLNAYLNTWKFGKSSYEWLQLQRRIIILSEI